MEHEAKKHVGIPVPPEPEIPPKVEVMVKEDKQFLDYWDILPNEMGEKPRWKYHYLRTWELFKWLPWGVPRKYQEVQASPIQLMEAESGDIQTLGEPQVRILNTSNDVSVLEEELSSQPANKAPERVINAEIEEEM